MALLERQQGQIDAACVGVQQVLVLHRVVVQKLQQKHVRAFEYGLRKVQIFCGWTLNRTLKNQPHFSKCFFGPFRISFLVSVLCVNSDLKVIFVNIIQNREILKVNFL